MINSFAENFKNQILSADDPWEGQIYTLKDAYAPREPLQYIVEGLFTLPSLSIIYGAPNTLKSFLLGDCAICVSGGVKFLGRKVIQSPVMWLDFDNGKRRTNERIAALAKASYLPEDTPFYYYSMPLPTFEASKPEMIERLAAGISNRGIKLLCIDNLGLISFSAVENSGDMIKIMGNLRFLSEKTGTAIVLIHHQRKANGNKKREGESLRGHSSIEAAIDLALLVDREEGSNYITIKSTKTRDLSVQPFAAEFIYENNPNTKELLAACFEKYDFVDNKSDGAIEKAILDYVRDNENYNQKTTVNTVQRDLDIGINRIRIVYNRLKKERKLK